MSNNGGIKLEQIKITLKDRVSGNLLPVYIDVDDNSLSRKWLLALNNIVTKQYHLEKNYCFFGFTESNRSAQLLCQLINQSVDHINHSSLDYHITTDPFTVDTVILPNLDIDHARMNHLHRWFEDLQGWNGNMSNHYNAADPVTRWHIRQLNLLCHELESLVLSLRKLKQAPEWRRPSQLMCWLNAPRYELDDEDLELFGIETINRKLGGVYVGVNKAVGKHHWEVFCDEGRDSRISELFTTGLRTQSQAAGDFDIEWARDPGQYHWQIRQLAEFREWLERNGFDPDDASLTIGHPCIGQVDLERSFGTQDWDNIYRQLSQHQDVYKIRTSEAQATYEYHWSDPDYIEQQIRALNELV